MESKSEAPKKLEELGADPMIELPTNRYGQCILKRVVGEERANAVLQSMSMTILPNQGGSSLVNIQDSK